jgi:serine/threonine protein kinase
MREEGGRTVLMDFGAGKDLDQDVLPMHVRGAHDFAGTPLYLAPEVFAGSRRTKAATT